MQKAGCLGRLTARKHLERCMVRTPSEWKVLRMSVQVQVSPERLKSRNTGVHSSTYGCESSDKHSIPHPNDDGEALAVI